MPLRDSSPWNRRSISGTLFPNREDSVIAESHVVKQASLSQLYEELSYAARHDSRVELEHILNQCTFIDGATNILHFALREPPALSQWQDLLLEAILSNLQSRSISLDLQDSEGRTPVEIALRGDREQQLEALLRHGADANRIGRSRGSPLQTALIYACSPEVIRCLLRHGADVFEEFPVPVYGGPVAPSANTSFTFVIERIDKGDNLVHWLHVISVLACNAESAERGMSRDMEYRILRCFARQWQSAANFGELFEAAKPLLTNMLQSGLDPSGSIDDEKGSEAGSLFHMAVFHSRDDSFARLIIEKSYLRPYGSAMVRSILCGCTHKAVASETVIALLCRLLQRRFPLDPGFLILDHLLMHVSKWPAEQRAILLGAVIERRPIECPLVSPNPAHHWALMDGVAACKEDTSRFELTERLLQPRDLATLSLVLVEAANRMRFAILKNPETANLPQTLQIPSTRHQQEIVRCFVHVVTKSAIQELKAKDLHARKSLSSLLRLRQRFRLPEIQISNKLVLATLQDDLAGMTNHEQNMHAVYGAWFD